VVVARVPSPPWAVDGNVHRTAMLVGNGASKIHRQAGAVFTLELRGQRDLELPGDGRVLARLARLGG
jgi:hypothetical protein